MIIVGWFFNETEDSRKMINRENERLKLSLKHAINTYGRDKEIIAFMHYPPIASKNIENSVYLDFYNTLKNIDKKY